MWPIERLWSTEQPIVYSWFVKLLLSNWTSELHVGGRYTDLVDWRWKSNFKLNFGGWCWNPNCSAIIVCFYLLDVLGLYAWFLTLCRTCITNNTILPTSFIYFLNQLFIVPTTYYIIKDQYKNLCLHLPVQLNTRVIEVMYNYFLKF